MSHLITNNKIDAVFKVAQDKASHRQIFKYSSLFLLLNVKREVQECCNF